MTERIAITGLGVVSAAGATTSDLMAAIENGTSALSALTLFDSPRCSGALVGQVPFDPAATSGLDGGSRTDHLAVLAAGEAFKAARLGPVVDARPETVGVALGVTTGGMIDAEMFIKRLVKDSKLDLDHLKYHLCANAANAVARSLSLRGPRISVSDACASGASAIATACDILSAGQADVMLAGGADSLTRLTINGFMSLLNVDPGGCKPFDVDRKGMSLGEGAGVLVLERESHARERRADPAGYITGHANRCDAFHATRPSPGGAGALAAMTAALDAAQLLPEEVDYINAHGTGTRENDSAEARAILSLFAPALPLVSSTKGYTGHTLAAAGAIEAVICVEAMKRSLAPGTVGLATVDPELGLDPLAKTTSASLRVALTNSLGFGGTNTSLVIEGVGR